MGRVEGMVRTTFAYIVDIIITDFASAMASITALLMKLPLSAFSLGKSFGDLIKLGMKQSFIGFQRAKQVVAEGILKKQMDGLISAFTGAQSPAKISLMDALMGAWENGKAFVPILDGFRASTREALKLNLAIHGTKKALVDQGEAAKKLNNVGTAAYRATRLVSAAQRGSAESANIQSQNRLSVTQISLLEKIADNTAEMRDNASTGSTKLAPANLE